MLSIEGELYEIAQGQGKWGGTQACLAEIEGEKYLVYVFSRSQKDELQSFAGVFDLKKKRDVYVSQALSVRNLSFVNSENPTFFPISDLELYEEGDHGLVAALHWASESAHWFFVRADLFCFYDYTDYRLFTG